MPLEVVYDVIQCKKLTDTITAIRLQAPLQQHIAYQAGQYIKVIHGNGTLSPLSIACLPGNCSVIELHLAHPESNQQARDILSMIQQTKKLRLCGPYGNCTAAEFYSNHPVIFLARGTGFAPIKSIIEELINFKKYPAMHLYWSAASSNELYMNDLPKHWAGQLKNFSYTPLLSRANETWQGETGLLQQIILRDHPNLLHYRILASAPEAIVHAALQTFLHAGLKRENYFSDVFVCA